MTVPELAHQLSDETLESMPSGLLQYLVSQTGVFDVRKDVNSKLNVVSVSDMSSSAAASAASTKAPICPKAVNHRMLMPLVIDALSSAPHYALRLDALWKYYAAYHAGSSGKVDVLHTFLGSLTHEIEAKRIQLIAVVQLMSAAEDAKDPTLLSAALVEVSDVAQCASLLRYSISSNTRPPLDDARMHTLTETWLQQCGGLHAVPADLTGGGKQLLSASFSFRCLKLSPGSPLPSPASDIEINNAVADCVHTESLAETTWLAVQDFNAFRIAVHLSTQSFTPLSTLHETAQTMSSQPVAEVLLLWELQQRCGAVPYAKYAPKKKPRPTTPSMFGLHFCSEDSEKLRWVTGAKVDIDAQTYLPTYYHRGCSLEEMEGILSQLIEERKVTTKFSVRSLLYDEIQEARRAIALLKRKGEVSVFCHPDVLAQYVYDCMPPHCDDGSPFIICTGTPLRNFLAGTSGAAEGGDSGGGDDCGRQPTHVEAHFAEQFDHVMINYSLLKKYDNLFLWRSQGNGHFFSKRLDGESDMDEAEAQQMLISCTVHELLHGEPNQMACVSRVLWRLSGDAQRVIRGVAANTSFNDDINGTMKAKRSWLEAYCRMHPQIFTVSTKDGELYIGLTERYHPSPL